MPVTRHQVDLTREEREALTELGLPPESSSTSHPMLLARVSQLPPASYAAFHTSTHRLLASWVGVAVPDKYLRLDPRGKSPEFAAWLGDALERLQGGDRSVLLATATYGRGGGESSPSARGSGVVSLPKISARSDVPSPFSSLTSRVVHSHAPSQGASSTTSVPPWQAPLAAIFTTPSKGGVSGAAGATATTPSGSSSGSSSSSSVGALSPLTGRVVGSPRHDEHSQHQQNYHHQQQTSTAAQSPRQPPPSTPSVLQQLLSTPPPTFSSPPSATSATSASSPVTHHLAHQQHQQQVYQQHHANHHIQPVVFSAGGGGGMEGGGSGEGGPTTLATLANSSSSSSSSSGFESGEEGVDALRRSLLSFKTELSHVTLELGKVRGERDAAVAQVATLSTTLATLETTTHHELVRLREAADVGMFAAREHAAEDLRAVLDARADESLKARAALQAQVEATRAAMDRAASVAAELRGAREAIAAGEAEALRARAERMALTTEVAKAREALAREVERSGSAEEALREEFAKVKAGLLEEHGRALGAAREAHQSEVAQRLEVVAAGERVRAELEGALDSAARSHATEVRELRASAGEAARVAAAQMQAILDAPRGEVQAVQEVLGRVVKELAVAREEGKKALDAGVEAEGGRKLALARLETEKSNSTTLRLRSAIVEGDLNRRLGDLTAKLAGHTTLYKDLEEDFSLYAPSALEKVGFLMPQEDGRKLPWGPVIEGSVAAWRAANPSALVANLEGRRDVGDDDVGALVGVRALNLAGCMQVTDGVFAGLPGLRALDLSGCTQVTDAAFVHLGGVRELSLGNCTQGGVLTDAALTPLHSLKALDLSFASLEGLGDTGLARVGGTLAWLRCEGASLPTLTGTALGYLPCLQHLSLTLPEAAPTAFTDAHFATLAKAPLKSLLLWNTQSATGITDKTLGALPGLKTLELSFRAFKGQGLPPRSRFTRAAFSAQRGRLERLALHGEVPEVLKEAARGAYLRVSQA